MERFRTEIQRLGDTDDARAKALKMSKRSLGNLKALKFAPQLRRLVLHPQLLRALADDAEQSQTIDRITTADSHYANSRALS
jgi:hypothetical protein